MKDASYSTSLVPAVLGILVGAWLTTASLGSGAIAVRYAGLPEFQLWRTGMVAQAAIYLAVAAFIWVPHAEWRLPKVPLAEAALTGAFTVLVVMLPNLVAEPSALPLPGQGARLLAIVSLGLFAVVGITHRVAQLHHAFRTVADPRSHARLRQHARDLLGLAALVVTMATLGSGLLQISVSALAAVAPAYPSPLTDRHVIAYGGYFSLLLVLFFTPLLAAERSAALRILAERSDAPAELVEGLGLHASFTDNLRSAFGVLAPLLGALATRLLS